ncbi:MAG TPA: hypothetical protein VFZ97_11230 [Acidimicrobiales bacterium]
MDHGEESGEQRFSRDDDPSGEAWEPDDEAGHPAWDDGSQELWDDAEPQGEGPDDGPHTALPPKVEAWRRRSATGAVLTGFAFGLQQVFEPREQPAIIMETSGDPPKDLPVDADLEYGRPRHSVVSIRPWLFQDDQVQNEGTPDPEPAEPEPAAPETREPEPGRDQTTDQDQTTEQNGSGS